jgi:hypothetical protein
MKLPRLRYLIAGTAVALALAAAAGVVVLNSEWAAQRVGREAEALIEARFDGRAQVDAVSVKLFPWVQISGSNLRITRSDGETPFLQVARFEMSGSPLQLLRRSAARVDLDGFELFITKGRRQASAALRGHHVRDVHIGQLHVNDGRLLIIPDNPDKLPLEFSLHEVTLTDFRFDRSTAFAAKITNPKPRALIQTEGHLGPWDTAAPRATPLSGVYLFNDGELDAIKGLGGHLTSSGNFDGVLERLKVQGTTSSRDFQLDLANQPVPLQTQFKATVDGTRGDVVLDDIDALLGQSRIRAHGAVTGTRGVKGRTVALKLTMKDARFQDLHRLTIKGTEPPMRGRLDVDAEFELPPGEDDVPLRLLLNGTFAIRQGQFASDTTQNKIDELSRRGRGEPANQEVSNVMSAFGSAFTLRNGVLQLPRLRFDVKGARIDLGGRYTLRSEALDFTGAVRLEAPVSQTVTGFKSVLLKAVDPLFRRDGAGTVLPIRIAGTVDKPAFKLDVKRVMSRD